MTTTLRRGFKNRQEAKKMQRKIMKAMSCEFEIVEGKS